MVVVMGCQDTVMAASLPQPDSTAVKTLLTSMRKRIHRAEALYASPPREEEKSQLGSRGILAVFRA
eukprot:1154622-Pelagomonas_calceolata.AAC.1